MKFKKCFTPWGNNSPDKIKRAVITQNYKEGGVRMVNVYMFMNALKITWIRKILGKENKYSLIVKHLGPVSQTT